MMVPYNFDNGNGTGNLVVEGVVNGRARSGLVRSSIHENPHSLLRIASWNVGTLKGRSNEIVETISRRKIDICCVQEVRWRGASTRLITGKDSVYKLYWVGNKEGTNGVGVFLAERWIESVYNIKRVSDRILLIKLILSDEILTVLSVYAPQTGLENNYKDKFYDQLQTVFTSIANNEIIVSCGDWNGHVGRTAVGYEDIHGGFGFGELNDDGERILDFAVANDLAISNTFFCKRDNHLITYHSGSFKTQIDLYLYVSNI